MACVAFIFEIKYSYSAWSHIFLNYKTEKLKTEKLKTKTSKTEKLAFGENAGARICGYVDMRI